MAKIRKGKYSGKIGNTVFVNDPHGQVLRSRPSRRPRSTNAKLRALANRILVARTWRTLMEQQRAAWAVAARKEKMKPYPFWLKINCTLLAYGQPLVMDPPKREKIKPNPVGKLEMLNQGGAITLRLGVPEAPAKLTFVFGLPWCSPGISVPRSHGVLLGRLDDAVEGWSDITKLYQERFGVPPVGGKVFIWTRQLVNGRTDALKQTSAIVPGPEGQGT